MAKMSIQNVLTAALFKRDDAGRTVVFPNGAVGRGYYVPDAATEQKLRRKLMWAIVAAGLLGGIGMQIMLIFYGQVYEWSMEPWVIAAATLAGYGIAYRVMAKSLIRGMEPAEQRMGAVEALKVQAEAMPRWYLWFMAVVAVLTMGGLGFWMVVGASLLKTVLSLGGIALFAVVMMQAVHGLTQRPQS
jgi:hypothetical protein